MLRRFLIVGLLLVTSIPPAFAGFDPSCFGRLPTHSWSADPDTIFGDDGKNVIRGGKGDDRIFAGAGRDFVCGNKGDDVLFGGEGFDRINGGKGFDLCSGEIVKNCERRVEEGL